MTALCAEGARCCDRDFVMKDQSIKDLSDEQISENVGILGRSVTKPWLRK
jgi:hypothetical protein